MICRVDSSGSGRHRSVGLWPIDDCAFCRAAAGAPESKSYARKFVPTAFTAGCIGAALATEPLSQGDQLVRVLACGVLVVLSTLAICDTKTRLERLSA